MPRNARYGHHVMQETLYELPYPSHTYAEMKSSAAHSRILRDEQAPRFGRSAASRRVLGIYDF